MSEDWKDVVGWEGVYQVSSKGRVWSRASGKVRTINPHKTLGYAFVTLKSAGRKQETVTVHAIMARAFLGPRPSGTEVLHGDGDRMGNRIENIRYGTRLENVQDTEKHGRIPHGEEHYGSKLTEADVLAIRSDSRGARRLSRVYGVCRQTLDEVKSGKTWKYLLKDGAV